MKREPISSGIQERIEMYVKKLEEGLKQEFNYKHMIKFVKVIQTSSSGGRSVFCFIDPSNGDIYKAASWSIPAKGVRGNVMQEELPLDLSSLYKKKRNATI